MNAYFQIIAGAHDTRLTLYPPTENGQAFSMNDLIQYLNYHKIEYQLPDLNKVVSTYTEETTVLLNENVMLPIREEMFLDVKENHMHAIAKFLPPSKGGGVLDKQEILGDLKHKGIVSGIKNDVIESFLKNHNYLEEIEIASGQEPRQGKDASIEYFFVTDKKARPTLLEDGSVDFFHLNIINHCNAGDLLARLHREDPGDDGTDIMGSRIKPHEVRRMMLKFGRNIEMSEDKLELYAQASGHVTLVDDRVFVSTLMEVENVDTSTGDIEYDGNVQVNGNVCSNFKVRAGGNVEVRGVVEGAEIVAGGNITIARGMNGMGKGKIKANGNIIAQFLENATVEAEGYVETGSMLHSEVSAGTEIHVNGRRGFISGGHVSATSTVEVKTLGSEMGTSTVIEIGISPGVKKRYKEVKDQLAEDEKIMNRAIPILEAARGKLEEGIEISEEQAQTIRGLAVIVKEKRTAMAAARKEEEELKSLIEIEKQAQVIVHGTVYPGTKIVISDVSKIVKDSMTYCRFIKSQGDVRMIGIV